MIEVFCLGTPAAPCHALRFRNATILLDCGMDCSPLMNFLPLPVVKSKRLADLPSWSLAHNQPTVCKAVKLANGRAFIDSNPEVLPPLTNLLDLSSVDAILVSNSLHMLALPFITECTGFSGRIYATQPAVQLGRLMMEEVACYISRANQFIGGELAGHASWKDVDVLLQLPPYLRDAIHGASWRTMYTMEDVSKSLSSVDVVGFGQQLDLFGLLSASAHSSGFSLGSCNWIIQSEFEKIVYLSASSSLTTHSLALDQSPLRNADLLLLTGLKLRPSSNPDGSVHEICSNMSLTLKMGGNVLFPVHPSGVVYDLLECLPTYLEGVGLGQIPIYLVSPAAEASLAFSNIFGEWLCTNKQNKMYQPEAPFSHAELIKSGRLQYFSNVHGDLNNTFRTPCVVFAGHPSLRFGDAVHFLEVWGHSNANTLIMTEPDFSFAETLAPFQPLAMKALYCPIDTRLNFRQCNQLLHDLKPDRVIAADVYSLPPPSLPHRSDFCLDTENIPCLTISRGEVLDLSMQCTFQRALLSAELAGCATLHEIRPGLGVASLPGCIVSHNNHYYLVGQDKPDLDSFLAPNRPKLLSPPKREDEKETSEDSMDKTLQAPQGLPSTEAIQTGFVSHQKVWGQVSVDIFLKSLAQQGVGSCQVESSPSTCTVNVQKGQAVIRLEDSLTTVQCHGNESLRKSIYRALMDQLQQF